MTLRPRKPQAHAGSAAAANDTVRDFRCLHPCEKNEKGKEKESGRNAMFGHVARLPRDIHEVMSRAKSGCQSADHVIPTRNMLATEVRTRNRMLSDSTFSLQIRRI